LQRYRNSIEFLARAQNTIPLGSQTFSKSRTQYPVGISPLFASKAKGCNLWDLDGNKYVDLVSSLASVTVGYCDKSINAAVKKQLKKGTIFSLPGILEAEVSELIVELVPSAEMVRFGKNGTDATTAAVRLARAYTGKDRVLVCGYHGWQDWYIGTTTRNKGIPFATSNLSSSFTYNNLDSFMTLLDKYSDIACVVMEPFSSKMPEEGFLEKIREMTHHRGIVLIFDETVTGFRVAKGGAQELLGITPDLTTMGKGIANGYPLSAVAGRKEIMMEMENIFYSGTFGGELLSLAAAKSVLQMHQQEKITPKLFQVGDRLQKEITRAISENDLSDSLTLTGHPSWIFLNWSDFHGYTQFEIKTYFMQEMFEKGVLLLNTHNVTTSFQKKEINFVIDAYREVLLNLAKKISEGSLRSSLKVEPIKPLFSVR
jgi:glutamate-1-semialdehyde 2,1-aminomutase